MPQVSTYINKKNLEKIDAVRGRYVKRSTLINEVFNLLDESWLRSLLK